jgi:hypothetical protein
LSPCPESGDSLAEDSQDRDDKRLEEMLAEEAAQLPTIDVVVPPHSVKDNAKKAKPEPADRARGHKRQDVKEDAKEDKPVPERRVKSAKTVPGAGDNAKKVIDAARAAAIAKPLPAGKSLPRPLKKPAAALKRPAAATEKDSALKRPAAATEKDFALNDDDRISARYTHAYLGGIALNNDKDSSRIRGKDKDNVKYVNLCSIAGSVPNRHKIANLVWQWMLSDAMAKKNMTKEMIIAKKDLICKEVNDAAAEDSEDDEDDEDDDDDDDDEDPDE